MDAPVATQRKAWMSTLAKAPAQALHAAWDGLDEAQRPEYEVLRPPEIGLVMVRGRAGGVGDRFNLGEMTVTRCAVRLVGGETGLSYRSGRDKRAAEIAAVLDGMLQGRSAVDGVRALVARLEGEQRSRRAEQARRSGATKVQFFTMTRTREDRK